MSKSDKVLNIFLLISLLLMAAEVIHSITNPLAVSCILGKAASFSCYLVTGTLVYQVVKKRIFKK